MATITVGELVYKITGDASGFRAEIVSAEGQAKKSGKKIDKNLGKLKKTLIGIGVAAAAAFGIFVKKSVEAASDAEEVAGKFGTVFASVGEDAEKASKKLADGYLLSRTEAKKLLSNTGDLLSGFGFTAEASLDLSSKVQVLAADLASFSNVEGGVQFASEALTKSLFGETEQAKSLGIVIQQNSKSFKKAVKDKQRDLGLTAQQAKAEVIFESALAQSKNAIGDIARTSGSYANQQRRLNANLQNTTEEFGKGLIPALKLYQKDLIEATGANQGLGKAAGEWIGKFLIGIKLVEAETALWIKETVAGFEELTLGALQAAKALLEVFKPEVAGSLDGAIKALEKQEILREADLDRQKIKIFELGEAYASVGKKTEDLTNKNIRNTKKITKTATDEEKKRLAKSRDEFAKFSETIGALGQTETEKVQTARDEQLKSLQSFLNDGVVSEQAAADLRVKINEDASKKITAINRAQWEKTVGQVTFASSTIAGLIGQTADVYKAASDNRLAVIENERVTQETAINDQYAAEVEAVEASALTAAAKATAIQEIEAKKATALELLEIKIAKRQKKEARESAKLQKNLSIAQTAFQIPEAAFSAFKSAQVLPFPASAIVGAALAAGAVGFGALQIKNIREQPLPALAAGGLALGPSIVGEAGRELAVPLDSDKGKAAIDELAQGIQKTSGGLSRIDLHVYLNGGEILYKDFTEAIREGQVTIEAKDISA